MKNKKKLIIIISVICICLALGAFLLIKIFSKEKVQEKESKKKTEKKVSKEEQNDWDIFSYRLAEGIIGIEDVSEQVEMCMNEPVSTYRIIYQSDDYELEAILSVPQIYIEEKEKCPCIIYNRDGYGKKGLNTAEYIGYLASISKAAVFAPQYRGYNETTGKDEFGGADVNDVINLINLCEKIHFIDMKKLYMLGVGRGGMMTYMTIRKDSRIKKAIVYGGIADTFTSYKYNKVTAKELTAAIGGNPKTKSEEYKSRSAVYWANEIKCPVMVIHSKKNKLITYKEYQEIIYALKKNNKEYKTIVENDFEEFTEYHIGQIDKWLGIENLYFEQR